MADINVTNDIINVNVTEEVVTVAVNSGAYPLPATVYSVFGRTENVIATEGDYSLTQLSDVTLTSPANGQVLKYNGTAWVNGTDNNTVTSVFGRTNNVVATSGDYTTTLVTEGSNLYFTNLRAQSAISLTIIGTSGEATYSSGVLNIPNYGSALSSYVPYSGATNDLNLGTHNLFANNFFDGFTNVAASGTQIVLTIASTPSYTIIGSGGQTIKLPDATTLPNGAIYSFNNNQSSGAINVNNNSNTLIVSIPSGGYAQVVLLDNSISAGSWDRHFQAPANVSWSTNTLDYAGSITSATWNGATIQPNRGGTGQSTYTDGQLLIGNTTGNTLTKANLSAGTGISITNGGGSISIASTITQYTDALARASISLTTTGTSGASTYNPTTGVFNIPQYSGGSGMVYPAAGIALSTGSAWGTSITDNSANWNTAYTNRITSLTTTGTSGAATLVANVLNIPNHTLAGLGGIGLTALTATTPLTYNNTTGVFNITQASASANGYLASGDFNTFNGKQGAITLTTTGTSGAATLVGTTLNIPQYSGGGGSMAIGGTITSATAGSVLFAGTSGILSQNNANFFWDNTNARLGLGTASPSYTLDVNGPAMVRASTGNTAQFFLYATTSESQLKIQCGNGGGLGNTGLLLSISTNIAYIYNYSAGAMIFGTNNTERMRIESGGNLGIGTTTIGSKLQVNGNAAIGYSASTAAPTNGLAVAGQSTFADNLTVSKNQNAATSISLSNTTSGTSSQVQFSATSDSTSGANTFGKYSSTTTAYKIVLPKDAYYYNGSVAGDFAILNDYSAGSIKFAAGGSSTAQLTLNSSGAITATSTITSTQYNISALNTAPATATSTGTLGEIRFAAGAIYVCTATNTWVRTLLTTF